LRLFRQEQLVSRVAGGYAHLGQLQEMRKPLMDSSHESIRNVGRGLHELHSHLDEQDHDAFRALSADLRRMLDEQVDSWAPSLHRAALSDLNLQSDVFYSRQMTHPETWDDLRDLRFTLMVSENAHSRLIAKGLLNLSLSYWAEPRTIEGYGDFKAQADALEHDIRSVYRSLPDDDHDRAILDVQIQRDCYVDEINHPPTEAGSQAGGYPSGHVDAEQEAIYMSGDEAVHGGHVSPGSDDRWWER
jgi:hypothetical protein